VDWELGEKERMIARAWAGRAVAPDDILPEGEVDMVRTVEAVIDEQGQVSLLEQITLPESRRALVTILEDALHISFGDAALLSEAALAQDWDRPEEDQAWSSLQPGR
jgi:hypothetical protein